MSCPHELLVEGHSKPVARELFCCTITAETCAALQPRIPVTAMGSKQRPRSYVCQQSQSFNLETHDIASSSQFSSKPIDGFTWAKSV